MNFGVIVKALRVRKGWSQEEFALKIHLSRSAVGKIENDQQTLDVPTLIRMVQVTNEPAVAVSILLGMDGISILQNIMQIVGVG
jgi:transcriptional regulator with XRE-family HTH domain